MKRALSKIMRVPVTSPPARGRGLKLPLTPRRNVRQQRSPPARGRGLKHCKLCEDGYELPKVAPRTGARIETYAGAEGSGIDASPPARGRGLKQQVNSGTGAK